MTENQTQTHSPAVPQPEAEHQEEPEQAVARRRSPQFGHAEAQVVAAAQEEAVEQDLLPPSQDEDRTLPPDGLEHVLVNTASANLRQLSGRK